MQYKSCGYEPTNRELSEGGDACQNCITTPSAKTPKAPKASRKIAAAMLLAACALIVIVGTWGWGVYRKSLSVDAVQPHILTINSHVMHVIANPDKISNGEFFEALPKIKEAIDHERILIGALDDAPIPEIKTTGIDYATKARAVITAIESQVKARILLEVSERPVEKFSALSSTPAFQSLLSATPSQISKINRFNMAAIEAEHNLSKKIQLLKVAAEEAKALSFVEEYRKAKSDNEQAENSYNSANSNFAEACRALTIAGEALDSLTGRKMSAPPMRCGSDT